MLNLMMMSETGFANYISVENYDVKIKFLYPNGPAA